MEKFECLLRKTYQFNVEVAFTPKIFHLGTLKMSHKDITIQFSCEYAKYENEENFHRKYEEVFCQTRDLYFKLFNLEMINASNGVFHDYSYNHMYFRATYSVQYVICSESPLSLNYMVAGFSIYSKDINRWIGNTKKQEAILNNYESPDSNAIDLSEFSMELSSDCLFKCNYTTTVYHNSTEYMGGISYPPRIIISYLKQVSFSQIIKDLYHLLDIFSFLIGENIVINDAKLTLCGSHSNIAKTYIYFRHGEKKHIKSNGHVVFFPLGKDLRFRMDDVPEFPIKIFKTFFDLNDYKRRLIKQLLKARAMAIGEDKYLSIFRVAEKLSFRNGHNTKDNMMRAYEYIKDFFPDNFLNDHVEKMVDLRNDISHANEYSVDDRTLQLYIGAVDVLATYLIMKKLLIIDEQIIVKVLPRHRELQSMVVPKIYYSDNGQKGKESKSMDSLKSI
jgi:hypothetical protein